MTTSILINEFIHSNLSRIGLICTFFETCMCSHGAQSPCDFCSGHTTPRQSEATTTIQIIVSFTIRINGLKDCFFSKGVQTPFALLSATSQAQFNYTWCPIRSNWARTKCTIFFIYGTGGNSSKASTAATALAS